MLSNPNRWQPLIINGAPQKWLLPQWGLIRPFATASMRFSKEALAAGPFLYPGLDFLKQALDIVDLSAHLGDREKAIAEYWADGFTTVTPPGHWCLLAQEVSTLVAIGAVLRHRSIDTTAQYAKVDVLSLKQVAQPWPGGASC